MTEDFLRETGMSPELIDLEREKRRFSESIPGSAGEAGRFRRTYLRLPDSLPEGRAAVLDAGGTRLRSAFAELSRSGARLEKLGERKMPGTEREITPEKFFAETADFALPAADRADRLGFCFSYVIEALPDGDARIEGMCKELRLCGAEGLLAGEELKKALRSRGRENIRIRLLNDSAAVLLGGIATTGRKKAAALILGTGLNVACVMDGEIINLEAGTYAGMPRGEADIAVDARSERPGDHMLEKMLSGAYLKKVMDETLLLASKKGIVSDFELEQALAAGYAEADALCAKGNGGAAAGIFAALYERAARAAAAVALAACERTGADTLFIEGSTYWKNITLRRAFERCVSGRIELLRADDAALLGSAAAALL